MTTARWARSSTRARCRRCSGGSGCPSCSAGQGIISFESNGAFVLVRGRGLPRVYLPGFRDIRGYRAMYRDFAHCIRTGATPEMSLETAMADQRLMERVTA